MNIFHEKDGRVEIKVYTVQFIHKECTQHKILLCPSFPYYYIFTT